jgi:CheY-like chemotaxis protein
MWLIAEDEADIRNLVNLLCTSWGYQTMIFEDGQSVWDWLDKVEAGSYQGPLPVFALMDIRMPGKKGSEIAVRIRETAAIAEIPVVLMTAFSLSNSQQEEMMNSGVDAIIPKPLPDFAKLHAILHEVIYSKTEGKLKDK